MTENANPEQDDQETVEIDMDHPWIMAALAMHPEPGPASAQLLPVGIPAPSEDDEERTLQAAMLTTVSQSGVQTVFLPPKALVDLIEQAGQIFDYWDQQQAKQPPGLIIANQGMQHAAQQVADQQAEQERRMRTNGA